MALGKQNTYFLEESICQKVEFLKIKFPKDISFSL
jgi:hypothetical protein